MTEVIIDIFRVDYLIDKLRTIFTPYIIKDENEYVLDFDNDIGNGTFTIVVIDNKLLNIYFKGQLHKSLELKLFNSKNTTFNLMYLQQGTIGCSHGRYKTVLKKDAIQQLIYYSTGNVLEVLSWSANELIEFNLIKIFDVAPSNANDRIPILEQMKPVNFEYQIMEKATEIKPSAELLNSNLIGKSRQDEIETKIIEILDCQLKNLNK